MAVDGQDDDQNDYESAVGAGILTTRGLRLTKRVPAFESAELPSSATGCGYNRPNRVDGRKL